MKDQSSRTRKKSEKYSFVILSDSEESDIIEILRRFAPQNDMGEGLLRMTLRGLFTISSRLYNHKNYDFFYLAIGSHENFYRDLKRYLK